MTIVNVCLIIIALSAIVNTVERCMQLLHRRKELAILENNLNDAKERFFDNMEGLEHLMKQNDEGGIS